MKIRVYVKKIEDIRGLVLKDTHDNRKAVDY